MLGVLSKLARYKSVCYITPRSQLRSISTINVSQWYHTIQVRPVTTHLCYYGLHLCEVMYAVDTQHNIITRVQLLQQHRLQIQVLQEGLSITGRQGKL